MIKVLRVVPGWEPEITGDDYVPLMIGWGLVSSVYARFVWAGGRICCEVALDRWTGRVSRLAMLEVPTVAESPPSPTIVGSRVEPGLPVFDRAIFGLNSDDDPQASAVDVMSDPETTWSTRFFVVMFFPVDVHWWIETGSVGFGVTERDELVGLRLERSALPHAGPLARSRS